jgi:hypothetical protein
MKPMLKAPGTKLLKLKYDIPPSNFAFKFNLRRYTLFAVLRAASIASRSDGQPHKLVIGRVLHSSTFQLNLSRF